MATAAGNVECYNLAGRLTQPVGLQTLHYRYPGSVSNVTSGAARTHSQAININNEHLR